MDRPSPPRRALRFVPLALAFALPLCFVMQGCGSSSSTTAPTTSASDPSDVQALVTSGLPLVDDGSSEASESETIASAMGEPPAESRRVLAAIHPLLFWRSITSDALTYTVAFADSDSTRRPRTALVTVHRHLLGRFNIIPALASDSTRADSMRVIHKPLDDQWVRHLLLKRVANGIGDVSRWRLAGTSPVEITSATNSVQIQSVRVQSGAVDTMITDPAALFLLRRVVRIQALDSVRVTVTTNHADDVVLLHHAGIRRRFRNLGNDTYTIAWIAGPTGGWRHFTVDALAHGTVFDDAVAYDDNRWILPFEVTGQPFVDYYP